MAKHIFEPRAWLWDGGGAVQLIWAAASKGMKNEYFKLKIMILCSTDFKFFFWGGEGGTVQLIWAVASKGLIILN